MQLRKMTTRCQSALGVIPLHFSALFAASVSMSGLLLTPAALLAGLLGAWRDNFLRLHARPEYRPIYQANPRYRLFMHQAVLSAVILNRLNPSEIHWLTSREAG